jgi:hypothetical protein
MDPVWFRQKEALDYVLVEDLVVVCATMELN